MGPGSAACLQGTRPAAVLSDFPGQSAAKLRLTWNMISGAHPESGWLAGCRQPRDGGRVGAPTRVSLGRSPALPRRAALTSRARGGRPQQELEVAAPRPQCPQLACHVPRPAPAGRRRGRVPRRAGPSSGASRRDDVTPGVPGCPRRCLHVGRAWPAWPRAGPR